MKSSNFGYIPALDHLRGLAALLVLYFHSCHLIAHKLQSDVPYDLSFWPRANNPFSSLILEGHTAVSLFLYLVPLSLQWDRQTGSLVSLGFTETDF